MVALFDFRSNFVRGADGGGLWGSTSKNRPLHRKYKALKFL